MIAFRLACVPPKTSHHAKRIVKIGKFSRLADKPELVASKAMLDSLLLPHQPAEPITGPVALTLVFTWPWLQSQSKKVKALGRVPHTSRPDCSNLAKTLEDRLVALRFIGDDNAVVELTVRKFWGDEPGIDVAIQPWAEREALLSAVDEPIDTISTRDRFGLVQPVVNGYALDIHFRMLQPHELAAAMSFPKTYVFKGNREETVKQIGSWAGELSKALSIAVIRDYVPQRKRGVWRDEATA